jgi:hypothetical protein
MSVVVNRQYSDQVKDFCLAPKADEALGVSGWPVEVHRIKVKDRTHPSKESFA